MSEELKQAAAKHLAQAQASVVAAVKQLVSIHPLAQETDVFRELQAMTHRLTEVMQKLLRMKV